MPREWTEAQKQAARERELARRQAEAAADTEGEESFPPQIIEAPEPDNAYALFLASIDEDTRDLLGEDELRKIFADHERKAREEKRARAREAVASKALHAARMKEGLVPAAAHDELMRLQRMNELVEAEINLPPADENGGAGDIGLRIDQRIFLNGRKYTLTRGQWDSYREILYRNAEAELVFQGKSKRQRQWLLNPAAGSVARHIELTPDGHLA